MQIHDIKKIIGRSWETNLESGGKIVLAVVGVKTHEVAEIVEKKFIEYDTMKAEIEQLKASNEIYKNQTESIQTQITQVENQITQINSINNRLNITSQK